jgi:hypothetical protein
MQCKPASILSTIATATPDLIAPLTTKKPYFTHRRIWQASWHKAAEPYDVLSIIPIQ